jgi:hypothetical protein
MEEGVPGLPEPEDIPMEGGEEAGASPLENLKQAYYKIEDKYYELLDSLDERGIPVYSVVDPIEGQGIPTFPLIIGLLLFLLILLIFLLLQPGPSAETLSIQVSVMNAADDKPIEGATVKAVLEEAKMETLGATLSMKGIELMSKKTDANGKAVLNVTAGNISVRVSAEGCDPQEQTTNKSGSLVFKLDCLTSPNITEGDCLDIAETLYKVKLKTPDNKPLKNCRVEVLDDGYRADVIPLSVINGELYLPTGEEDCIEPDYQIRVICDGYELSMKAEDLVNTAEMLGYLTMESVGNPVQNQNGTLTPANNTIPNEPDPPTTVSYSVYVVVKNEAGDPVPNIEVTATNSWVNPLDLNGTDGVTGEDGRVDLKIPSQQKFKIKTHDPQEVYADNVTREYTSNRTMSIEITLYAGRRTVITVIDSETKEPIENATLILKEGEYKFSTQKTNQDGQKAFVLKEGKTYQVEVSANNYDPQKLDGVTAGNSYVVELEEILEMEKAKLAVKVRSKVGDKYLQGVYVEARKKSNGLTYGDSGQTNADGYFEVGTVKYGEYEIYTNPPDGKVGEVDLQPGEDRTGDNAVEVTIYPPLGRVKVFTYVDGKCAKGVQVQLIDKTFEELLNSSTSGEDCMVVFDTYSTALVSLIGSYTSTQGITYKAETDSFQVPQGEVIKYIYLSQPSMEATFNVNPSTLNPYGTDPYTATGVLCVGMPYFEESTSTKYDTIMTELWIGDFGDATDEIATPVRIGQIPTEATNSYWQNEITFCPADSYNGQFPGCGINSKSLKYVRYTFSDDSAGYQPGQQRCFNIPFIARSELYAENTTVYYRAEWLAPGASSPLTHPEDGWSQATIDLNGAGQDPTHYNDDFYYVAGLTDNVNTPVDNSQPSITVENNTLFYLKIRATARHNLDDYQIHLQNVPPGKNLFAVAYWGQIIGDDYTKDIGTSDTPIYFGKWTDPETAVDVIADGGTYYEMLADEQLELTVELKAMDKTTTSSLIIFQDDDSTPLTYTITANNDPTPPPVPGIDESSIGYKVLVCPPTVNYLGFEDENYCKWGDFDALKINNQEILLPTYSSDLQGRQFETQMSFSIEEDTALPIDFYLSYTGDSLVNVQQPEKDLLIPASGQLVENITGEGNSEFTNDMKIWVLSDDTPNRDDNTWHELQYGQADYSIKAYKGSTELTRLPATIEASEFKIKLLKDGQVIDDPGNQPNQVKLIYYDGNEQGQLKEALLIRDTDGSYFMTEETAEQVYMAPYPADNSAGSYSSRVKASYREFSSLARVYPVDGILIWPAGKTFTYSFTDYNTYSEQIMVKSLSRQNEEVNFTNLIDADPSTNGGYEVSMELRNKNQTSTDPQGALIPETNWQGITLPPGQTLVLKVDVIPKQPASGLPRCNAQNLLGHVLVKAGMEKADYTFNYSCGFTQTLVECWYCEEGLNKSDFMTQCGLGYSSTPLTLADCETVTNACYKCNETNGNLMVEQQETCAPGWSSTPITQEYCEETYTKQCWKCIEGHWDSVTIGINELCPSGYYQSKEAAEQAEGECGIDCWKCISGVCNKMHLSSGSCDTANGWTEGDECDPPCGMQCYECVLGDCVGVWVGSDSCGDLMELEECTLSCEGETGTNCYKCRDDLDPCAVEVDPDETSCDEANGWNDEFPDDCCAGTTEDDIIEDPEQFKTCYYCAGSPSEEHYVIVPEGTVCSDLGAGYSEQHVTCDNTVQCWGCDGTELKQKSFDGTSCPSGWSETKPTPRNCYKCESDGTLVTGEYYCINDCGSTAHPLNEGEATSAECDYCVGTEQHTRYLDCNADCATALGALYNPPRATALKCYQCTSQNTLEYYDESNLCVNTCQAGWSQTMLDCGPTSPTSQFQHVHRETRTPNQIATLGYLSDYCKVGIDSVSLCDAEQIAQAINRQREELEEGYALESYYQYAMGKDVLQLNSLDAALSNVQVTTSESNPSLGKLVVNLPPDGIKCGVITVTAKWVGNNWVNVTVENDEGYPWCEEDQPQFFMGLMNYDETLDPSIYGVKNARFVQNSETEASKFLNALWVVMSGKTEYVMGYHYVGAFEVTTTETSGARGVDLVYVELDCSDPANSDCGSTGLMPWIWQDDIASPFERTGESTLAFFNIKEETGQTYRIEMGIVYNETISESALTGVRKLFASTLANYTMDGNKACITSNSKELVPPERLQCVLSAPIEPEITSLQAFDSSGQEVLDSGYVALAEAGDTTVDLKIKVKNGVKCNVWNLGEETSAIEVTQGLTGSSSEQEVIVEDWVLNGETDKEVQNVINVECHASGGWLPDNSRITVNVDGKPPHIYLSPEDESYPKSYSIVSDWKASEVKFKVSDAQDIKQNGCKFTKWVWEQNDGSTQEMPLTSSCYSCSNVTLPGTIPTYEYTCRVGSVNEEQADQCLEVGVNYYTLTCEDTSGLKSSKNITINRGTPSLCAKFYKLGSLFSIPTASSLTSFFYPLSGVTAAYNSDSGRYYTTGELGMKFLLTGAFTPDRHCTVRVKDSSGQVVGTTRQADGGLGGDKTFTLDGSDPTGGHPSIEITDGLADGQYTLEIECIQTETIGIIEVDKLNEKNPKIVYEDNTQLYKVCGGYS